MKLLLLIVAVIYIFASIISAQANEIYIYGVPNTAEYEEIISAIDLCIIIDAQGIMINRVYESIERQCVRTIANDDRYPIDVYYREVMMGFVK